MIACSCLPVRAEERVLAYTLVQRQHSLLSNDLHLNVCLVDKPSVTGSLDLVGYFTEDCYGCEERVWVELKAWSATNFDKNLQTELDELPGRLLKEQRRDSSLSGVLLVCLDMNVHVPLVSSCDKTTSLENIRTTLDDHLDLACICNCFLRRLLGCSSFAEVWQRVEAAVLHCSALEHQYTNLARVPL